MIMQDLLKNELITLNGKTIYLKDVSYIRKGDSVSIIADTLPCQAVVDLSKNARIMLCESTYLEQHRHLAESHYHMTAKQAATQALMAGAQQLVLTHFSARYLNTRDFEIEAGKVFPNVMAAEEFRSYPFPKNSSK